MASPAGKKPALARARAAGLYRVRQGAEKEGAEKAWPKNPEGRRSTLPPATYLEIGDRRRDDAVIYPDVDLHLEPAPEGRVFTDKKGEPY